MFYSRTQCSPCYLSIPWLPQAYRHGPGSRFNAAPEKNNSCGLIRTDKMSLLLKTGTLIKDHKLLINPADLHTQHQRREAQQKVFCILLPSPQFLLARKTEREKQPRKGFPDGSCYFGTGDVHSEMAGRTYKRGS